MSETLQWHGWSVPVLPEFSYATDYSDVLKNDSLFVTLEGGGAQLMSQYPFHEYSREPYGLWRPFDRTQNGVRLEGLYREQQDNFALAAFLTFRLTGCAEREPEDRRFTGEVSVTRKLTGREEAALRALLFGIKRIREDGGDGMI